MKKIINITTDSGHDIIAYKMDKHSEENYVVLYGVQRTAHHTVVDVYLKVNDCLRHALECGGLFDHGLDGGF